MKNVRALFLISALYVTLLTLASVGVINDVFASNTNSEEVEQVAEQENEDCDGSFCENLIVTQTQSAIITNTIGGSGGNYEDVSNSAEIEQVAEQENKDCDGSTCINDIITQA